jgi:ABC-type multidrug transport system fused ATPase/permease subunit
MEPPSQPFVLERARGEIRFHDVWYEYKADKPVLKGIDITIPPGRHVAVVGRNGAGKSTLASLVPRLRGATSGEVTVDGTDVRTWDLLSLRRQIAYAFQDAILFDGTILENIQLGRMDASEAEIHEAARLAGVTVFASALPEGFETPVGEGGLSLSGGQRQRVALARTLLRDAPILIFDEPAASLDSEAEILVTGELMKHLRGRTVLWITHKIDTIEGVDEILVLEAGSVVERGTFEELGGREGLRRHLGGPKWTSSRSIREVP